MKIYQMFERSTLGRPDMSRDPLALLIESQPIHQKGNLEYFLKLQRQNFISLQDTESCNRRLLKSKWWIIQKTDNCAF